MTFGADPHKVKKIVKRIGEELTPSASHGIGLPEPLKSKGVIRMEGAP